jgi:cytochrome c-type biogenesis protein CcmH/NrfG
MSRLVPLLCVTCALAIGGTAWVMLCAAASERIEVPATPPVPAPAPTAGLGAALQTARRSCDVAAVSAVLADVRTSCAREPDHREHWHLLAEAHLERSLLRSHDRGIVVGAPLFPQPPKELLDDLEQGLVAAKKAHELGDDSSDLFRIEAGLMSQHITGLASALHWNGKIQDALRRAGERAPDNPHLHVALGLRKLLAPKLLGHDPAKALEHFEFAAKALVDDERPAVFAAMASYLQQKRLQAIAWLEQAVACNPQNRFARVVLARLRAGEDDAFGRDLTAAEIAAAR